MVFLETGNSAHYKTNLSSKTIQFFLARILELQAKSFLNQSKLNYGNTSRLCQRSQLPMVLDWPPKTSLSTNKLLNGTTKQSIDGI